MITLYNTLHRKKEIFTPIHGQEVGLYTCGPTVYHYVHIGNLRCFIFEDILSRVLRVNDYEVTHVMNITDVGHLTDDRDQGEDKMEKGSRREGKTAWDVAAFYTDAFLQNIHDLNILTPNIICKATDHITEQIDQVQLLIDKGFTYENTDGIYFDTTKLLDYGALAQLDKQALQAGSRVDMGEKKHPHDFALWKFSRDGEKRQMEWEAFGRMGFPGWHIECSAMSMKYLGNQFDIHCGGIDHIPVHHTNEIAQAEASTGLKPWVRYWLHNEFLLVQSEKMAKSGDNFITLQTVTDKRFSPLSYRYFILQTHYRKQLNFTWQALEAAQTGLTHLYHEVLKLKRKDAAQSPQENSDKNVVEQFLASINDDLNIPEALASLWTALAQGNVRYETVIHCDRVLGLEMEKNVLALEKKEAELPTTTIPEHTQKLLDARAIARAAKNWPESDRLRDEIAALGYLVEDTQSGQKITKT